MAGAVKSTKMNVAVVGCGQVAEGHLSAWNKIASARTVAVCDINNKLVEETAKRWNIPSKYFPGSSWTTGA